MRATCRRSAAAWLAWLVVGCTGQHEALREPGEGAAGEAAPREGVPDAAGYYADPRQVAGHLFREGANAARTAIVDSGDVADVGASYDAGRPPTSKHRIVPSIEALEAAGCRVSYDADDDGVIDARWGFEYGSTGRLQRLTYAAGDPLELQVTDFDAEERPRLSCTEHRCARFELSADGTTLRVDSHVATQLEREPTYELRYDDQGRMVSWQHVEGDEIAGFDRRVQFVEGVASEATFQDFHYGESDVVSWSFFGDGELEQQDSSAAWRHHSRACTDDGWQSDEVFDDEAGVAYDVVTEYTRDATGRIVQSHTTVSGPTQAHEVVADWAWNESGGAVTLSARDTATDARWTFDVAVQAGELAREHDPETGELLRVLVDLDGDGAADTAHRYSYEGTGPCRDGSNPQLRPLPTDVLDPRLPDGCRFSPGVPTLLEAYELAQP